MACMDKNYVRISVGDTVQDKAGSNHTVAECGHFIVRTTENPITSLAALLRANETAKQ